MAPFSFIGLCIKLISVNWNKDIRLELYKSALWVGF